MASYPEGWALLIASKIAETERYKFAGPVDPIFLNNNENQRPNENRLAIPVKTRLFFSSSSQVQASKTLSRLLPSVVHKQHRAATEPQKVEVVKVFFEACSWGELEKKIESIFVVT